MQYARAVQALTDLYQYFGKGELAEAILDALARIAHPSSATLFSSLLASKTSAVKGIAIEGLARAGDRNSLAPIQAALGGERSDAVRLAGTFAAVRLSDGPLDPLIDALQRPKLHDQARQYLIETAPGRSAVFQHQLQDPAARVRIEIVDILGLAGDPAALPAVEPLVKDHDPLVAMAAERALARLRR
jgi:HEAT repeat protein